MKYLFYIAFGFSIISCNSKQEKNSSGNSELSIDPNIASLYPLNGKWLDLQNPEYTSNSNESRNFKKSAAYNDPLKTDIFSRWCEGGQCYQLNQMNLPEVVPQTDGKTQKANKNAINFLIPFQNGLLTATSLPQENIFTVRYYDLQLNEKWSTIYEKSRIDSAGHSIHYAEVLGYNEHLLAFHSNSNEIRKSGYINLDNGIKKQEEAQWTNLLIDDDQRTVLGQLIQNKDQSYSLMIGNRLTPLSGSVTGYSESSVLLAGNNIFLGFYYPQTEILKLIALDYHTGNNIWEYSLTSSKSIQDVIFSDFQDQLIVEIEATQGSNLYIFNQAEGKLSGKF